MICTVGDPVGPCGVSLAAMLPSCQASLTPRPLLSSVSDYVIDDKVAVLQKREHEGFGFVLRGAKGKGVSAVWCWVFSVSCCPLPSPMAPPASALALAV